MKTLDTDEIVAHATPLAHQQAHEIQPYGHLVRMPIALSETACKESVQNLNQILADTITLRDLYKKHHWQVAGPTLYQLHLLFYHDEMIPIANSYLLAENLPNAILLVYPNAGHGSLFQVHDSFTRHAAAFLAADGSSAAY